MKIGLCDHSAFCVSLYPLYQLLNGLTNLHETWLTFVWHLNPSQRRTSKIHINSMQVSQEDVKYLGLHPDRSLNWHKHFLKTETIRNLPHQNVLVTRTQVKTRYKQQTSHIKQYTNQSGLTEYNSGVRLPLPA
jgi:hypothetical protein